MRTLSHSVGSVCGYAWWLEKDFLEANSDDDEKEHFCRVSIQRYSIKTKVYKGFKINCSKAKIPESWPKNSFHVFETLFSGRKRPCFSFSEESRNIQSGCSSRGYIEFKTVFPDSSQIVSPGA